jgi:CHAT domain-containing protein
MNTEKEPRFLIEEMPVISLPSSVFINQKGYRGEIKAPSDQKIFVCADRSFPGVDDLLVAIQSKYPESIVVETAAVKNKKDFISQLKGDYQTFIFIGHGRSNTDFPEMSELEIGSNVQKDSAVPPVVLTLGDLLTIGEVKIGLAVLIGCKTGYGKLFSGTGMLGFNQGLHKLGITNVISTYWNIEAVQSIRYVTKLMISSTGWSNPAKNLRQAQLLQIINLRKDSYFKFPHPYFWGAFNLSSINSQIK